MLRKGTVLFESPLPASGDMVAKFAIAGSQFQATLGAGHPGLQVLAEHLPNRGAPRIKGEANLVIMRQTWRGGDVYHCAGYGGGTAG